MTKYKQYFQEMYRQNQLLFDQFQTLNEHYKTDQKKWQTEFNQVGAQITEIVYLWEKKLCLNTEKGHHGAFSNNLSEKFRNEVKKVFPYFDFVGVVMSH